MGDTLQDAGGGISLGCHSACLVASGRRSERGAREGVCEHPCRVLCVNPESPLTLGLSGVCHPGGTFGSTGSALPCGRKQLEAVAAAAGEALWSPAPRPTGRLPVDVTCLLWHVDVWPLRGYQRATGEPCGPEHDKNILPPAGVAALRPSSKGQSLK